MTRLDSLSLDLNVPNVDWLLTKRAYVTMTITSLVWRFFSWRNVPHSARSYLTLDYVTQLNSTYH